MNKVQHSAGFLRRRKILLVLPVLILPFITLAFWALGGGKDSVTALLQDANRKGLNLELPNAQLKADNGLDKMRYYNMAEADSEKLKARLREDPYFKLKPTLADSSVNEEADGVAKVNDRLAQIHAALDGAKNAAAIKGASKVNANLYGNHEARPAQDLDKQQTDRLDNLMQHIRKEDGSNDSEMIQINAMLDKVMDIQHPERVNEKRKKESLTAKPIDFVVTHKDNLVAGFYGETPPTGEGMDSSGRGSQLPKAIEAVVSETQTLVNGGIIKLRVLDDVYVNGFYIPANTFVFGKGSLAGERLSVGINSIRYQDILLPVALSVFDMDGMDGIYVPGAITRDVAKQSSDNALQSIALNSFDPSIGTQAASAGIETAKNLINKKIKLVRVTVKAGYRVLLKDNNQQ